MGCCVPIFGGSLSCPPGFHHSKMQVASKIPTVSGLIPWTVPKLDEFRMFRVWLVLVGSLGIQSPPENGNGT